MVASTRSRILFLLFVVLGVYYPTLFGEVNSVDDYNMIASLADQQNSNWLAPFISSGGYYYRPLLWCSYMADKHLWDLAESFMHLENILLHAANTVLVFLLGRKILRSETRFELPLIGALLFALHPANTESVAWISGRTDPLASLFVLSSALFLLKGLEENRYRYLGLSTLLLLLGCLCKEVAVFFLPAACFIVLCHEDGQSNPSNRWFSPTKLRRLGILTFPFLLSGVAYLCLRISSSDGSLSSVLQSFSGRSGSLFTMLRVSLKVFGFYVKKLFMPLPLNFAIFKVSNHYVWLGIAAAGLLGYLGMKRRTLTALAVTVGILILPAVLVALSGVAWTPYAERYLYLPSAFFAVTLVGGIDMVGKRATRQRGWLQLAIAVVVVGAGVVTAQRNFTWQSNLALYQDTAKKSPQSPAIKNELAIALTREGRTAEAERQLDAAKSQDPRKQYALPYVNQANLKVKGGDLNGARRLILQVLGDDATSDPSALRTLAAIDEKRLFEPLSPAERKKVYREIAVTHQKLYKKTGNPVDLYRGGQMELFLGEKDKARILFEQAYQAAPDGTYFKPAAKKLAEKLKQ